MRIIWIDDMRDPNQTVRFGTGTNSRLMVRFMTVLPQDLYKRSLEEDTEIVWCRNYDEFVDEIYHSVDRFDENETFVCFDHDLGEEKTGLDCAKFLVDYVIEKNDVLPGYEVHSSNLVGKENIISYLESYKKSIS